MARLYTTEIPTGCEVKEVTNIPIICTVIKESSFVNVAVSPLNAGETRVMITCVEKPSYKWNLQVWCDYSGRWEYSGPTRINIQVFIRLWETCIAQGIKVIATMIKNQKLGSVTATTGHGTQGLGTVTAEFSSMDPAEIHVSAQVAETEETHTMAFVTNAAVPKRTFNLRVHTRSAKEFVAAVLHISTLTGALKRIVPVRVSTRTVEVLQTAKLKVYELRNTLTSRFLLKVDTNVPQEITATMQVRTGVIRGVITALTRVFTRNITSEVVATAQVRTQVMDEEVLATARVHSDLIVPKVTKLARLQVFLVIPEIFRKVKLQVFTMIPEIKLLSYIRSNLYQRVRNTIKSVYLSASHHTKNTAAVISQALHTSRERFLFAYSSRTDGEKTIYASTGAQRGITRNVEGIPLATVDTRKIYIGPVLPVSLYHTLFVRAYTNSIDTTIALLFSTSVQQTMNITVTAYIKRLVAFRMIQWYLHHIDVGNEGMANEIVFDLGDVDPVGPVPPVPDEVWGGGYVDYPFKGLGYQTTQEASGYVSPDPEEWVQNARMFWERETEIFDEESTE